MNNVEQLAIAAADAAVAVEVTKENVQVIVGEPVPEKSDAEAAAWVKRFMAAVDAKEAAQAAWVSARAAWVKARNG